MRDGRRKLEKKWKKKCADHVREKGETKFDEWAGEWITYFVSNFTHQNFLVKMVKLLKVVF